MASPFRNFITQYNLSCSFFSWWSKNKWKRTRYLFLVCVANVDKRVRYLSVQNDFAWSCSLVIMFVVTSWPTSAIATTYSTSAMATPGLLLMLRAGFASRCELKGISKEVRIAIIVIQSSTTGLRPLRVLRVSIVILWAFFRIPSSAYYICWPALIWEPLIFQPAYLSICATARRLGSIAHELTGSYLARTTR